jgi:predicted nucleotidyltransferase
MVATSLSLADHLNAVAQKAVLSANDRGVINISLKTLLTRLRAEFDKYEMTRTELFGAFTRDTSLPHALDKESDVDVMVVFNDMGNKPGHFVEKLKHFAELHYPRTAVVRTGTSIYIELLHTRFDLVPAKDSLRGLQIPVKGGDAWQVSDVADAAKSLQQKDAQNAGLILPLVRLAKYWNARNDHPVDPFALEQRIVAHSFTMAPKNIKAYFFDFMRSLTVPLTDPVKAEKVRVLRKSLDEIDKIAQSGDLFEALARMQALLPLPATAPSGTNPFLRRSTP